MQDYVDQLLASIHKPVLPEAPEVNAAPAVDDGGGSYVEQKIAELRAAPNEEDFFGGVGRAFGDTFKRGKWKEKTPFFGGAVSAEKYSTLWSASSRLELGTQTRDDEELLIAFLSEAQREEGIGYMVGDILTGLPGNFIEFLVSGGAWTAGKKAGLAVAGKGLREAIETSARKTGLRLLKRQVQEKSLGGTVAVAARSGAGALVNTAGQLTAMNLIGEAAGGSRIRANAWRRALPELSLSEEDSGRLAITFESSVGDFYESLPKAIADEFIEVLSERSGEALLAGASKIPGVGYLAAMQADVARWWSTKYPGTMGQFLKMVGTAGGWNGPLSEYLEERFGGALRGATGVEEGGMIDNAFPRWEQQAAELIAFSVPGAGASAISTLASPGADVKVKKEGFQKTTAPEKVMSDAERNRNVRALETKLNKAGRKEKGDSFEDYLLVPADAPEGAPEVAASKRGMEVVYVKDSLGRPLPASGALVREGVAVVDVNAKNSAEEIISHELAHNLRQVNPKVWEQLKNRLSEEDSASLLAFTEGYARDYKKAFGAELTDLDALGEEGVSRYAEERAGLLWMARTPEGRQELANIWGNRRSVVETLRDWIATGLGQLGVTVRKTQERRLDEIDRRLDSLGAVRSGRTNVEHLRGALLMAEAIDTMVGVTIPSKRTALLEARSPMLQLTAGIPLAERQEAGARWWDQTKQQATGGAPQIEQRSSGPVEGLIDTDKKGKARAKKIGKRADADRIRSGKGITGKERKRKRQKARREVSRRAAAREAAKGPAAAQRYLDLIGFKPAEEPEGAPKKSGGATSDPLGFDTAKKRQRARDVADDVVSAAVRAEAERVWSRNDRRALAEANKPDARSEVEYFEAGETVTVMRGGEFADAIVIESWVDKAGTEHVKLEFNDEKQKTFSGDAVFDLLEDMDAFDAAEEAEMTAEAEMDTSGIEAMLEQLPEMPRTKPDMFGETKERPTAQRIEGEKANVTEGSLFQEDTGVRGQSSLLDAEFQAPKPRPKHSRKKADPGPPFDAAIHRVRDKFEIQRELGDSNEVILVGCCKPKLDHAALAKDLYKTPKSDLFNKARELAERSGRPWMILSAKHGLISPNTMVEPYDLAMDDLTLDQRKAWIGMVEAQLEHRWLGLAKFTSFAGKKYNAALEGTEFTEPLKGMQIGERKKELKRLLAEPKPLSKFAAQQKREASEASALEDYRRMSDRMVTAGEVQGEHRRDPVESYEAIRRAGEWWNSLTDAKRKRAKVDDMLRYLDDAAATVRNKKMGPKAKPAKMRVWLDFIALHTRRMALARQYNEAAAFMAAIKALRGQIDGELDMQLDAEHLQAQYESEAPPKTKATIKAAASKLGKETQRKKRSELKKGGEDVPFVVFLRANGGVRNFEGDLDAFTTKQNPNIHKGVFGLPSLVQKADAKGGMEIDHALDLAKSGGYLQVLNVGREQAGVNELAELLEMNPTSGGANLAKMGEQGELDAQRQMDEMARAEGFKNAEDAMRNRLEDPPFAVPRSRPWSMSSKGEGDLYIQRIGPNAGTVHKERHGPSDIALTTDPEQLLPDYLYYVLQFLQPRINARASGSVQQGIRQGDIDDVLVEHFTAPGIKYAVPRADQLGFYSGAEAALSKHVEKTGQKAFSPDSIRPTLKKYGAKDEELDWMGLDEWLDETKRLEGPKFKVELDDLESFIVENTVIVGEKVLGGLDESEQLEAYQEEVAARYESFEYAEGEWHIMDPNGETMFGFGGDVLEYPTRDEANRSIEDLAEEATERASQEDINSVLGDSMRKEHFVGPAQHGFFQLDGDKEGYRNLLLTLPTSGKVEEDELNRFSHRMEDKYRPDYGRMWLQSMNPEENAENDRLLAARNLAAKESFEHSHFGETSNVLAFVRFNERFDSEGNNILFLEEVQSDWHQEGRKKGYITPEVSRIPTKAVVSDEGPGIGKMWSVTDQEGEFLMGVADAVLMESTEAQALREARIRVADAGTQMQAHRGVVPDAPFKQTWPTLVMKRMVRWASEHGFAKIAWTTGLQQIERYETELRSKVSAISWEPAPSSADGDIVKTVTINTGRGPIELGLDERGVVADSSVSDALGKPLEELVGKAMAAQILEEERGFLEGEGMTIGGKGMESFYDERLVSTAKKLGKKFGAKVGPLLIDADDHSVTHYLDRGQGGNWLVRGSAQLVVAVHETKDEARRNVDALNAAKMASVHSMEINEAMRNSVNEEGFPRFAIPRSRKQDKFVGFDIGKERTFMGINIDRWVRGMTNKDLRTLRLVEAVKREGGRVGEGFDPYRAIEALPGKVSSAQRRWKQKYMDPLTKLLADAKITSAEFDEYVYARHAKERNDYITAQDPEKWAGSEVPPSGMKEADRKRIIAEAEGGKRAGAFIAAANQLDKINANTRNVQQASGLISKKTKAAWAGRYKHYVPLRTSFEDEMHGTGAGVGIRGIESKKAKGRVTLAHSPVTYSLLQAQRAYVRGYKNEVGNTFLKLVEENEALMGFEVREVAEDLDQELGEMLPAKPEPTSYEFSTKVQGKEVYIKVKDVLLRRALQNLGEQDMGPLVRGLAFVNRILSTINTSWDPGFVFSNFVRDVQTAGIHLTGERSAALSAKAIANTFTGKPQRAVFAGLRGKVDPNNEWLVAFHKLDKAGGLTGWYHSRDFTEEAKLLDKELKALAKNPQGQVRRAARGLGDFVDDLNKSVENGVRLSAFKAAIEAGVSEKEAASLAKNLTVNFNRRGEWGSTLNAFYLFYNASVQGSMRVLSALKRPKVMGMAAGIATSAMFLDAWNRAAGGDDEDGIALYDKIPEWVKSRNFIVMDTDGSGDYIKVPLPYGYNVFHAIGTQLGALRSGITSGAEASKNLFFTIIEAFNPLGSAGSLSQLIMPTLVDPIIQVGENKTFYGSPVAPTKFDSALTPDSQNYWSSVSPNAKVIAETLNELTGGDRVLSGDIDVSPETLEHVFEFATGGVGRFISRLDKMARTPEGEEVPVKDIPIKRRFVGEKSESFDRQRYIDQRDDVRQAEKRRKEYAGEPEQLRAIVEEQGPQLRMIRSLKQAESMLRKLRKAKRAAEAGGMRARVKQIEEQVRAIQAAFSKRYAEVVGA